MKQPYRISISDTYHSEFKKTRQRKKVRRTVPCMFKVRPTAWIINAKRRPCVQARLNKLGKYLQRAWAGYSFGELKRK